jgi:hypothetical protein
MFGLILFMTGVFFRKFSIFDDKVNSFALGICLMMAGTCLLIICIVSNLPGFIRYRERMMKFEKFSRYFIQASIGCMLCVLIIELTLRGLIFNPPLQRASTNWAGDIPAPGSMILWGKEGYAITKYEKWGEIWTPYQDDKNDNNIIIFGDSQTESLQVNDNLKFPSVAETSLRQDGYDADLYNFGRSGLAMADYVSWMPSFREKYQPNVIVVQLTPGDFSDSFQLSQFNYFVADENKIVDLIHRFDISSRFIQRGRKNYDLGYPQIQLQGSERWRLMQQPDKPSTDQGLNPEIFNPELARQQMELLISETGDLPLVVVLLPSAPSIVEGEIQVTDPGHEQLKQLFEKYFPEIIIVDPLPGFQQLASSGYLPRGFFNTTPGVGHLNQYGHEIVGQLLAETIEQILK